MAMKIDDMGIRISLMKLYISNWRPRAADSHALRRGMRGSTDGHVAEVSCGELVKRGQEEKCPGLGPKYLVTYE